MNKRPSQLANEGNYEEWINYVYSANSEDFKPVSVTEQIRDRIEAQKQETRFLEKELARLEQVI